MPWIPFRSISGWCVTKLRRAVDACLTEWSSVERGLHAEGRTVPGRVDKARVVQATGPILQALTDSEPTARHRDQARDVLLPWLCRSQYFARSLHQPHGFPGDFRTLELIYDLEGNACEDPTQPGIVNCLDYLFSQLTSVRTGWERRKSLARYLAQEDRNDLSVLDVGCGGARYIRDWLVTRAYPGAHLDLVDTDPAALQFCQQAFAHTPTKTDLHLHRGELHAVQGRLSRYDVVICAGLFEYLSDVDARALMARLTALTFPQGLIILSNFHPRDPSRAVNEWLLNWPLRYRTEAELAALCAPHQVETVCTLTGAAIFGLIRT